MIEGRQEGPFTLDELAAAGVRPDTYVWCKDYDDWQPARDDGEICRYFRRRLFDRMHPQVAVPVENAAQPEQPGQSAASTPGPRTLTPEEEERLRKLNNVPFGLRWPLMKSQTDFDWPDPDAPEDTSKAPTTWYPYPILFSVIFFFPLGLWAVYQARKALKAWNEGHKEEAHEFARRGKISAGLAFSFGLILIAVFVRALMG